MITNKNDILKKLNHGLKEIRDAVKLAKSSLIIGEINFPRGEKKIVKERLKKLEKAKSEAEGEERA